MIHQHDPNTRYTACGIKAWPCSVSKAEIGTISERTYIEVAHSQRQPTCPECLAEMKKQQEKRNGR